MSWPAFAEADARFTSFNDARYEQKGEERSCSAWPSSWISSSMLEEAERSSQLEEIAVGENLGKRIEFRERKQGIFLAVGLAMQEQNRRVSEKVAQDLIAKRKQLQSREDNKKLAIALAEKERARRLANPQEFSHLAEWLRKQTPRENKAAPLARARVQMEDDATAPSAAAAAAAAAVVPAPDTAESRKVTKNAKEKERRAQTVRKFKELASLAGLNENSNKLSILNQAVELLKKLTLGSNETAASVLPAAAATAAPAAAAAAAATAVVVNSASKAASTPKTAVWPSFPAPSLTLASTTFAAQTATPTLLPAWPSQPTLQKTTGLRQQQQQQWPELTSSSRPPTASMPTQPLMLREGGAAQAGSFHTAKRFKRTIQTNESTERFKSVAGSGGPTPPLMNISIPIPSLSTFSGLSFDNDWQTSLAFSPNDQQSSLMEVC